jgi:hypothetical protein
VAPRPLNHPDQVAPVHSARPHAGSHGLRRADTIRQIAATMTVRSDGPDRRGSTGERSSGSFARAPCLPASDRRAASESRAVAVSRTKRSRAEAAAAVASHGEAGAIVPTHRPLVAIRPSKLAVARSTAVASRSAKCRRRCPTPRSAVAGGATRAVGRSRPDCLDLTIPGREHWRSCRCGGARTAGAFTRGRSTNGNGES